MDFDDIRLDATEGDLKGWIERCSKSAAGICDLANPYRQRDDCLFMSMHCGSFNFSYRLHWDDDGEDWLIRFPAAGKSMFLDEKVRNEVAIMKYISKNTIIPVPKIIGYGMADENPTGLGPFIIMTWVEGKKMSELLRQKDTTGKSEGLDPGLDEYTLKTLYLPETWRRFCSSYGNSILTLSAVWIWMRKPILGLSADGH